MRHLKTPIAIAISFCLLCETGGTAIPTFHTRSRTIDATSQCSFSALSPRPSGSSWTGNKGYAEPFDYLVEGFTAKQAERRRLSGMRQLQLYFGRLHQSLHGYLGAEKDPDLQVRLLLEAYDHSLSRIDYRAVFDACLQYNRITRELLNFHRVGVMLNGAKPYDALIAITIVVLDGLAQNRLNDIELAPALQQRAAQLHQSISSLSDVVSAAVSEYVGETDGLLKVTRILHRLSWDATEHQLRMQSMHAISLQAGLDFEQFDVDVMVVLLDAMYARIRSLSSVLHDVTTMQDAVSMAMIYYARFTTVQQVIARHWDLDTDTWMDQFIQKNRGMPFRVAGMKMKAFTFREFQQPHFSKPFSSFMREPFADDSQQAFQFLRDRGVLTPGGTDVFQDDRGGPVFTLETVLNAIRKSMNIGREQYSRINAAA